MFSQLINKLFFCLSSLEEFPFAKDETCCEVKKLLNPAPLLVAKKRKNNNYKENIQI